MLNFQTLVPHEPEIEEEEVEPTPTFTIAEADNQYGKFLIEPLPKGYGMTLGNPLRRVLYGSLPGTAITWVKIESVLHEYGTIPHVKEEVGELLMNVKGIRLRSNVDRPGKLRLEVAGQGETCAGDVMTSTDFEIVNPELHLATLDSDEAKLSLELNVEQGTGYVEASERDGLPIGVLPVDAIFTPVRKVNYSVEDVRVGQRTDFERLALEIWTDGSITPIDAMRQAGNLLAGHFFLFANAQRVEDLGGEGRSLVPLTISPEQYNIPVERLDLSSRTLNCLKRAGIDKIGQVLEMQKADLLQIRNFGEKSAAEMYNRLREMDLLPPELDPDIEKPGEPEGENGDSDDATEASAASEDEPEADAVVADVEGV